MPYDILFKFDCEDEAPNVYIIEPNGSWILEVFAEPTCTAKDGWSWDHKDWTPPPFATELAEWLNARNKE